MQTKQVVKVFKKYHRQLYIYAIAITKNREMAEDAVHDALIAVAQSSSKIRDVKAYLFTTLRNKAIYACSQANKLHTSIDEILFLDVDTTQQQVFASKVFIHLEKLNSTQQQIIIMKVFAELTFKEIAQATNIPINTVASSYRRGLQKLKEKINAP